MAGALGDLWNPSSFVFHVVILLFVISPERIIRFFSPEIIFWHFPHISLDNVHFPYYVQSYSACCHYGIMWREAEGKSWRYSIKKIIFHIIEGLWRILDFSIQFRMGFNDAFKSLRELLYKGLNSKYLGCADRMGVSVPITRLCCGAKAVTGNI